MSSKPVVGMSLVRVSMDFIACPETALKKPQPCLANSDALFAATVAVCDACEDGYYAFRHNDEQGHCKLNAVTLRQAGFSPDAVGVFDFQFWGSAPSDFREAPPTVTSLAINDEK